MENNITNNKDLLYTQMSLFPFLTRVQDLAKPVAVHKQDKSSPTLIIWSFDDVRTQFPFWFHLTQSTVFLCPWLQSQDKISSSEHKSMVRHQRSKNYKQEPFTNNEQSSLPDLASQSFTRLSFPPNRSTIQTITSYLSQTLESFQKFKLQTHEKYVPETNKDFVGCQSTLLTSQPWPAWV